MRKRKKRFCIGIFVLTVIIAIIAPQLVLAAADDAAGARTSPAMRLVSSPKLVTIGNDKVTIDISNVSEGYVAVNYRGDNPKTAILLAKQDSEIIYNLDGENYGADQYFTLHEGAGSYEIEFYEHAEGKTYNRIFCERIDVALESETAPFLHASEYVSFAPDNLAVLKAGDLAESADTDFDVVTSVLSYLETNVEYDQEMAETVSEPYVPDVDQVLLSQSGLCLDYATVMVAMLRSQGIPARVLVGQVDRDVGIVDHAWSSVYLNTSEIPAEYGFEDTGFAWVDVDPTYFAGVDLLPWVKNTKLKAEEYDYTVSYCY